MMILQRQKDTIYDLLPRLAEYNKKRRKPVKPISRFSAWFAAKILILKHGRMGLMR